MEHGDIFGWTCYIHLQYITLKKRAVYSSETILSFYQTAWHVFLEDRNLHIYCHANFTLLILVCTECVSSANKVSWHQFLYSTTLNSWYKNNWNQTVYGIYDCILIPMCINYSVCSFLPFHTCNKKTTSNPHQSCTVHKFENNWNVITPGFQKGNITNCSTQYKFVVMRISL